MPSIDELKEKKRFKKKAYRPWNLLDDVAAPTSEDGAAVSSGQSLPAPDIASISPAISPANNQHIASISPAISPADHQQRSKPEQPGNYIASISPAISPADTPANRQQTTSKSPAKWSVVGLSGKEALLLKVIFNHCKSLGTLTTEPLSSEQLAQALEIRTKRLNNVVERLLEKRLIEVVAYRPGRGAWRRFKLSDATYREAAIFDIASKSPANNQHITSISPSISPAISPAERSSSSSSLRSNNSEELLTTGAADSAVDLDVVWREIDSSPLSELRFGLTQITQVARTGRLTPEQLQDSIYAFAFDLSENQKAQSISGSPLNYFMGILRKGPYAPPANYESPEDQQQRIYLEAKEQLRKRRQEQDARLEALEFEEWAEKLSLEQRAELVPPKDFAKPGGTAHNYQLREYFRENVWPELRQKIAQKQGQ